MRIRTIEAEFKVDSAFVKAAPTIKTYRVVEYGPSNIKIICINRTRDIPYCDTFDVEERITISSLKPTSRCCIVKVGICLNWHKSTMMKSMIRSATEKESKSMNEDYQALLKQFPFVEQRKPALKGAPIEIEDYTTDKQLKALLAKEKPRDDFIVCQEINIGLSAAQFWEKYF